VSLTGSHCAHQYQDGSSSRVWHSSGWGFFQRDLTERVWQHGCISDAVVSNFHGLDIERDGVNAEMDLAPLVTVIGTMLLRLTLAFAEHFDTGTVHQQVQARRGWYNLDRRSQRLLVPAHGILVGNGSFESRQLEQALRHPQACRSGKLNRYLMLRQD
jgi:hypothetical protein